MSKNIQYQLMNPGKSFSEYVQKVNKFPLLSFEKEQSLAKQWIEEQNEKAREEMIASHLRLVVRVASGYKGYGLPVGDLISEGNIGLVRALKRFNPAKGYRLATYAIWWIKASIQEYILHSWSLVKMGTTAAQKKLFFNLKKLKARLEVMEGSELKPSHLKAIAEELNVPEKDVLSMNRRLSGSDQSLNADIFQDGAEQWQDWLVDESQDQAKDLSRREERLKYRKWLAYALRELNGREKDIFIERRLRNTAITLDKLSKVWGISRERVRQIEVSSFNKIKKIVKNKKHNEYETTMKRLGA